MMTERIGGYHVVAHLGHGYQANSYKIEYNQNGYWHAVLKQFRIDAFQWKTLFSNEYKALTRLKHPTKPGSIPAILQYDIRERFIIMEFVPGQPLFLPQDKRLAFIWWFRLAEAIMYAHDRGVYHCDINPSNILVEGESVAVVDWASSKRARSLTNASRGLPRGKWQPPEQPQGHLGRQTDVYSLAAVLLWLISGYKPRDDVFQGPERRGKNIIYQVIAGPLGTEECHDLAGYLEQGTAGDAALRYAGVKRLYQHVQEWFWRHYGG